MNELTFKNGSRRQQNHPCAVELIVDPGSPVDIAILEFHFTLLALIIPPVSREGAPVNPSDRALPVASARFKVTFVSGLLHNTILSRQTANIFKLTPAAWLPIAEATLVFVSIFKSHSSHVVETGILDKTWLLRPRSQSLAMLNASFYLTITLEQVTCSVFILSLSFCAILSKGPCESASIYECDTATTHSSVLIPVSVVVIAIRVVVDSCSAAFVGLEVSFVELAITRENLNLSVGDL